MHERGGTYAYCTATAAAAAAAAERFSPWRLAAEDITLSLYWPRRHRRRCRRRSRHRSMWLLRTTVVRTYRFFVPTWRAVNFKFPKRRKYVSYTHIMIYITQIRGHSSKTVGCKNGFPDDLRDIIHIRGRPPRPLYTPSFALIRKLKQYAHRICSASLSAELYYDIIII